MHDLDPVFRAYSRSPRMAAALRAIGFESPVPVQSMVRCAASQQQRLFFAAAAVFLVLLVASLSAALRLISCVQQTLLILILNVHIILNHNNTTINQRQPQYIFKQPRIGGEVVPHQDSTFLWTDPPSCVGAWLALEDADKSNGCLWGLKASHNAGVARRFVRAPAAEGGGGQSLVFTAPAPEYDLAAFDPLEVTAGTLVLLHGANVHYSAENASNVSRHSYTLHFVEAGREWPADNWAQRPKDMPWEPLY
jgi:ectoine hydroxylase-related dioxygenase (phytanoyl-CoA dioxygenase family)